MVDPQRAASPAKAAFAAWLGSALEYYDFFLYGMAAALVFGEVYFPSIDPRLHAVASFATYGVGYIARPIGAVLLGHLGDRRGRKAVLMVSLGLMGCSTFLIGLLPGYAQIGVAAPILLVLLRLLQGLSVAGEHASANAMTLEHAPAHRRGFFSSFTLSGTSAGFILAALAFLPVSYLSEADRLAWGWRVPFLASVLLVVTAWWVRRSLPESPEFLRDRESEGARAAPLPLIDLLRRHRTSLIRVALAALVSVVSTVGSIFALAYAVKDIGIPAPTVLTLSISSSAVAMVTTPAWAWLADRVGRKPVFIGGTLASAALTWPFLWAIAHTDIAALFICGVLLFGFAYSAANGIWPALYGEMFDTSVRLSGMAIGTQIGFAFAGLAPALCAVWMAHDNGDWTGVAALVSAACVVATLAVATARETNLVPTAVLGKLGAVQRKQRNPR